MTSSVRWTVLACFMAMGTLAACGGALKYDLRGTQLSPGSDAKLAAKIDTTRNLTQLDLTASDLIPPDRVLPNGTAYVVWTRRSNVTPWVRLGALELTNEGRSGSALLTVSEVAFDLLISVEETPEVASPSGKTIFEQRVEE